MDKLKWNTNHYSSNKKEDRKRERQEQKRVGTDRK